MKLKLSNLQDVCAKMSKALDIDGFDPITNALELIATSSDSNLRMALTNYEYYVEGRVDTLINEDFIATVSADVFFKLISQLSTEEVSLSCDNNTVIITSNGTYRLPMLFNDDVPLKIPSITFDKVEKVVNVSRPDMMSVLTYNSRELIKEYDKKPVQRMYYLDDKGCITFTSGACVNNFSIQGGNQVLLSSKVINLFRLFRDSQIEWTFGECSMSGMTVKLLGLSDSVFSIVARINDDNSLIESIPKELIRNMAADKYPYTVILNKVQLLNAVERLLLFMPKDNFSKPYGKFEFMDTSVIIRDRLDVNMEKVFYSDDLVFNGEPITIILDFNDIKTILEGVKDKDVTIKFGNGVSVLIQYSHITNIIPECVL